jgi:sucrose-phosphate synthase
VPLLYQIAAASRGVFINPALTEPFGLTLIEAAASGLPIVATEDGGPIDIIKHCRNGILIDPLDKQDITKALLKVISDAAGWRRMARNGLAGVKEHYSWAAHAESYMRPSRRCWKVQPPPRAGDAPAAALSRPRHLHRPGPEPARRPGLAGRLHPRDAREPQVHQLRHRHRSPAGLGPGHDAPLRHPAPGRADHRAGHRDLLRPAAHPDYAWTRHIDHLWYPRRVREALPTCPASSASPTASRAASRSASTSIRRRPPAWRRSAACCIRPT